MAPVILMSLVQGAFLQLQPKAIDCFLKLLLTSVGSSDSTSGTGTASALSPILTPGDPLTGGGDAAALSSVSSSDESVSSDSVIVSELTVLDSISVGGAIRPIEGLLPPAASALGFLSDRLTIGWEKLDMAGVDEILVKDD